MPSKIDEYLVANATLKKGPGCAVGIFIKDTEVPAAERKAFEKALENKAIPSTTLSKAIEAIGCKVNYGAIQRHRRNECACLNK